MSEPTNIAPWGEEGRLQLDDDGTPIVREATCGTCGRSWNDALITSRTPVPSGRCPFEYEHEADEQTDEREFVTEDDFEPVAVTLRTLLHRLEETEIEYDNDGKPVDAYSEAREDAFDAIERACSAFDEARDIIAAHWQDREN